jgi:hypothetical protein
VIAAVTGQLVHPARVAAAGPTIGFDEEDLHHLPDVPERDRELTRMTAAMASTPLGEQQVDYNMANLAREHAAHAGLRLDYADDGRVVVKEDWTPEARRRRLWGDAWTYDNVDHAARLVSMARDVLVRAVVYARERGGRWDDIAEALNLTADQARDQYTAAIDQWEDALNRPWERSGRLVASRLPDGTTEPDETAADLDRWCLRHLEENDGARHNARHDGTEDRMSRPTCPSTPRSPR